MGKVFTVHSVHHVRFFLLWVVFIVGKVFIVHSVQCVVSVYCGWFWRCLLLVVL